MPLLPTVTPPTTIPPTNNPPTNNPPTTDPPTTNPPTTAPPMGPCPAQTFGNAMWPQTTGGQYAAGSCITGFTGNPQRRCLAGGTWEYLITNHCTRIICPSETSQGAFWSPTPATQTVYGFCVGGTIGNPYRECLSDGTWGPIQNPCALPSVQCASESYGSATWPDTNGGSLATGVCEMGYSGNPSRNCLAGGIWDTTIQNHCTRNTCGPENFENAFWPTTKSLTTVEGFCSGGTVGPISRTCSASGTWSATTGQCTTPGNCPSQSGYARADWPGTSPGEFAQGTCQPGWSGNPLRKCKPDGTWESLVHFHCQRA